jgi:hypothetical protein
MKPMAPLPLDHDALGLTQSKRMNTIDSES